MLEDDNTIHTFQSDGHLVEIKETSLQGCQDKRDSNQKGSKELLHDAIKKLNVAPSIMQPTLKEPMSLMDKSLELVDVHKYDEDGFPAGIVLLRDGRLVIVGDKKGQGPIMSVYNRNMILLSELVLDHDTYDICSLGDKEVAMTYFNKKRIDRFLILEDRIERHGGFSTKLYGRGISKHGNDIAILFTDEEGGIVATSRNGTVEIQIRKNDGKIIDTIDAFNDPNLRELTINDPFSILSLPNEDILVGDETHLRCFDREGDCRWYFRSYKDHAVKYVYGITLDGEGNILVCGGNSNNVHQLCANNFRQNRIIIDDINKPVCIAYDAENERIIVGCEDHYIRVFQFV